MRVVAPAHPAEVIFTRLDARAVGFRGDELLCLKPLEVELDRSVVLERIDDSPESILLEGLLEAINEFYVANIARESMKGMKENAYKALHNGGSPGLGYNVDSTKHYG